MEKSTVTKFFKWSAIVIVALVLVAVFVIVSKSSVNSFSVSCGKTKYLPTADNAVSVELGQAYYFRCTAENDNLGFDIFVVPSSDCENFSFVVNDRTYLFAQETDLSDGFQIEKNDFGFVLYLPQNLTVENVLKRVYKGYSVIVTSEINIESQFSLVVKPKSNSGAVTIKLNFGGGK